MITLIKESDNQKMPWKNKQGTTAQEECGEFMPHIKNFGSKIGVRMEPSFGRKLRNKLIRKKKGYQ